MAAGVADGCHRQVLTESFDADEALDLRSARATQVHGFEAHLTALCDAQRRGYTRTRIGPWPSVR
jgi:hypothetical protein